MKPRLDRNPLAMARGGEEPIETSVRGDVAEGVDSFHADDGVVVSEEGAQAVHPSRENERRYEFPSLPMLQVQKAQMRDLNDIFGGFGGKRSVVFECQSTRESANERRETYDTETNTPKNETHENKKDARDKKGGKPKDAKNEKARKRKEGKKKKCARGARDVLRVSIRRRSTAGKKKGAPSHGTAGGQLENAHHKHRNDWAGKGT